MNHSKIIKGKHKGNTIILLIQTAENAFIIVYAQGSETYIKDFTTLKMAMEKYNEII